MKKKGYWFFGLSGSGKTLATSYLKKKIKNSIVIDGDQIRKYVSYDLGYKLKDREIQISRVLGFAKISIKSSIVPIISTVYMNEKILKKAKQLGIKMFKVERNMSNVFRDHPTYKNNKKNIVGKDIFFEDFKSKVIKNDIKLNFFKSLKKIL
jgi:adenylylsulfate kinase-like enzyme